MRGSVLHPTTRRSEAAISLLLLSGLILGESVNRNGKSREKINKTEQNEVIPLDSDVGPCLYAVASNLEGRCTGSKESYGSSENRVGCTQALRRQGPHSTEGKPSV